MAETETAAVPDQGSKAEDIRAAGPATPTAAAPITRPGSSLDDIARAALGLAMTKQDALADAARQRAAKMRPEIEELKQAGDTLTTQATASIPKPPDLPPPPSRHLSGFLAPRQNETPEASVAKFISAMSLLATGTTALVKGNARTSLAALTGALKGWQEGDAERADRQFEDWRAKTDTMLTAWNNQRAAWEDWFKASKLSYDQKVKGLELAMLADGLELDAAKVDAEGAKYLFTVLDKQAADAKNLELLKEQIAAQREAARNTSAYREAHLEIERGKLKAAESQAATAAAAYDNPMTLKMLGQDYFLTGKLPPNLARSKSGQTIIPKIIASAAEWARENGMDPMSAPTIRAEVDAAKKGLAKVRGQNAVALSNAGNFEKHMDGLVALGKKVDRSGRPVLNRYILKVKGQYEGDADVAVFEAQAFEAAMEFSKVMVGSAQGDANTRDEARKVINSALNQQQLEAVATQLKKNAEQRITAYREAEAGMSAIITSVAGHVAPPPKADDKPAGGGEVIRYKRDASGKLVRE